MTTDRHDSRTGLVGPYVLGHLNAGERERVVEHLASCPQCRAEVERLRPVAAAMAHADPIAVGDPPASAAAPPRLLEDVLASVRSTRPIVLPEARPRNTPIAVAAVLLPVAAVAALVLVVVLRGPTRESVEFGSLAAGVTASAELLPRSGATEVRLEVRGLAPGSYRIGLVSRSGAVLRAGAFTAPAGSWSGSRTVLLDRAEAVGLVLLDEDGSAAIEAELEPTGGEAT